MLEGLIEDALSRSATGVERQRPGLWVAGFGNGLDVRATVQLSGDWLCLDVGAGEGTGPVAGVALWSLLERNAALGCGVKLIITAHGMVRLRGELRLNQLADPAARVAALCHAFESAVLPSGYDCRRLPPAGAPPPDQAVAASDGAGVMIAERCLASGWAAIARDGSAWVDLHTARASVQAVLRLANDGSLLASAAVVEPDPMLAPQARAAIALALLRAAAATRLARAAAGGDALVPAPRFDVRLAEPASDFELDDALAALAIACRWVVREAAILARDAAAAGAYLQRWERDLNWNDNKQTPQAEADGPAAAQLTSQGG